MSKSAHGKIFFWIPGSILILYSHCYIIANEIINLVVERLGVPVDIQGFENEDMMVEELTAIIANGSTSCFAPGAGNLIVNPVE